MSNSVKSMHILALIQEKKRELAKIDIVSKKEQVRKAKNAKQVLTKEIEGITTEIFNMGFDLQVNWELRTVYRNHISNLKNLEDEKNRIIKQEEQKLKISKSRWRHHYALEKNLSTIAKKLEKNERARKNRKKEFQLEEIYLVGRKFG